jgi:hypothetical protein
LGKKTGLPYLSEAKNMQVINERTWKKVSTAKGEAGKPDPKAKQSKAVDSEGERIEADVRDLSEAKNMWIKNIHIDIESICKRGRGEETRSKSKVDENGTMNESSSESARKMSRSSDPQEE